MTVSEAREMFLKYLWPVLLAWNIFLYQQIQASNSVMYEFRLEVARNYTSKRDLEKLFDDFERRMDKRLEQIFTICKPQ